MNNLRMKYIYFIYFQTYFPGYDRWVEAKAEIIDKNGDLGRRALLNRVEKHYGFRPDTVNRVECMCYEP